jgi:hypothetical protein
MSITSRYEVDHSTSLAKRFAGLAASYMDNPAAATDPVARVPLENLFRILEMYRYDAFEDEDRSGVLALKGFDSPQPAALSVTQGPWHAAILAALENARRSVFPADTKEEAVQRLQDGLRQLSRDGHITDPLAGRVKGFLVTFEASI